MIYTLDLTRDEIDYIVRRLREVDPFAATQPEYVVNKIQRQIHRNVRPSERKVMEYLRRFSYGGNGKG